MSQQTRKTYFDTTVQLKIQTQNNPFFLILGPVNYSPIYQA